MSKELVWNQSFKTIERLRFSPHIKADGIHLFKVNIVTQIYRPKYSGTSAFLPWFLVKKWYDINLNEHIFSILEEKSASFRG